MRKGGAERLCVGEEGKREEEKGPLGKHNKPKTAPF